jgi:hypothetical protein
MYVLFQMDVALVCFDLESYKEFKTRLATLKKLGRKLDEAHIDVFVHHDSPAQKKRLVAVVATRLSGWSLYVLRGWKSRNSAQECHNEISIRC